jgi:hypothetical protein
MAIHAHANQATLNAIPDHAAAATGHGPIRNAVSSWTAKSGAGGT